MCIRPVRYFKGLPSPLKDPEKVNLIIFRENTEDLYKGIEWKEGSVEAKRVIDFLRDMMNVPLSEDVQIYFEREVLPHAADAWIDHDKTKVGYEIPFNRHFYVFEPPRPLAEIDAELKQVTDRIVDMIRGLSA